MSLPKPGGTTARFAKYAAARAKQDSKQRNSFCNDFKTKGGKQTDVINRNSGKPQ